MNKRKELTQLSKYLKSKYFGINDTIDEIIEHIAPWYCEPESLMRSHIVCLWGMTGVGKTCLVRDIANFLDRGLVQLDIGDYASNNDVNSFSRDLFEKYYDQAGKQSIILLDEIHSCPTTNKKTGEDVDRSGIRGVWSLLSDGMVYVNSRFDNHDIEEVIDDAEDKYARDMEYLKIYGPIADKIQKEKARRKKETAAKHSSFKNTKKLMDFINQDDVSAPSPEDEDDFADEEDGEKETDTIAREVSYIKNKTAESYLGWGVPKVICKLLYYSPKDFKRRYKENFRELLEELRQNAHKIEIQPKLDFRKSLIFVLGNLDDVYYGSRSFDPDMSTEVLYKRSLSVNLSNIKRALSHLFKPEQVARLGNNHVIYPSLSRKAYEDIISKDVSRIIEFYKNNPKYGFNFDMAESVYDILYKESVFPTQGARTVLPSIASFLEGAIVNFVFKYSSKRGEKSKDISVSYNKKTKCVDFAFSIKGKKEKQTISIKRSLKVDKYREPILSESSVVRAVHEAGHIAASVIWEGRFPSEATIFTMGDGNAGYTSYDDNEDDEFGVSGIGGRISSIDTYMNEIKVGIAGNIAEATIFGANRVSHGSYSDFNNVTTHATNLVDAMGYECEPLIKTRSHEDDCITRTEHHENIIKDLVDQITRKVRTEFSKPEIKKYILDLSWVMLNNTKIERPQIIEITEANNIPIGDRYSYIKSFFNQSGKKVPSNLKISEDISKKSKIMK